MVDQEQNLIICGHHIALFNENATRLNGFTRRGFAEVF